MKASVHKFETKIADACVLDVVVETNGPQGGDSGHGGFVNIVLQDMGGTDLSAEFDNDTKRVVIRLGGDAEQHVIQQAMRFVADKLEEVLDPGRKEWEAIGRRRGWLE